jgi:hypothetical protein
MTTKMTTTIAAMPKAKKASAGRTNAVASVGSGVEEGFIVGPGVFVGVGVEVG